MALPWWDDDGPFIAVFGSSILSSTKKNVIKFGPPLTNLSGSAHGFCYSINPVHDSPTSGSSYILLFINVEYCALTGWWSQFERTNKEDSITFGYYDMSTLMHYGVWVSKVRNRIYIDIHRSYCHDVNPFKTNRKFHEIDTVMSGCSVVDIDGLQFASKYIVLLSLSFSLSLSLS